MVKPTAWLKKINVSVHFSRRSAMFTASAKIVKPQGETADEFEQTVSQVKIWKIYVKTFTLYTVIDKVMIVKYPTKTLKHHV